jgi:hypothetical protein
MNFVRFVHLLLTRRNTEREREREWIQREESDSERILRRSHEKE